MIVTILHHYREYFGTFDEPTLFGELMSY